MISIIIPCKKSNDFLKECLDHISKLDYENFEVIILPDTLSCISPLVRGRLRGGIRIVPTGPIKPGAKRNIGARQAQGEILAFIDDDAYPRHDWLSKAEEYFKDENITAVAGPGVTPAADSFWQQVSGAMYLSWFGGANPDRFWPGKKKFVTDWPSMNFLIRQKDYLAAGGFDEKYWPGEDSVLCNHLIKAGKKILYAPKVIVYHHRRKNLKEHLKQVGSHKRGLFARVYPENSRKFKYFLPSLFLLFALFGYLMLFLPQPYNLIYPILWSIYGLAVLTAIIQIFMRTKKPAVGLASLIYIPLTHLIYGFAFLRDFAFKQ